MLTEIHWTTQSSYPLLATLQLIPLLGIPLLLVLRRTRLLVPMAVMIAGADLLVAIDLYRQFDQSSYALQFVEKFSLWQPLVYHTAADGITVLFMLLTSLLCLLTIIYSRVRKLAQPAHFLPIVLAVEASLHGMFATQDLLWFTLLSAIHLWLVGRILWFWSTSPSEDIAKQRFLQFMGAGLVLLFAGTYLLGWHYADASGGQWSFNLHDLARYPLTASLQPLVFFLLFYGLGIRIPLFPLHGWLPLMAEHGTIAVAGVFLIGLKTGVYGLLRFVFPLLPDAIIEWHPYIIGFALTGVFYAALLALLQDNLRRLLAFAIVSHTSLLVIGLFSLSHAAWQGSIILSVNFGLAISVLLFMTGFIYRRTRTLLLPRLGGLFDHIPLIGITFLIGGLSIIGMPGTPGFDAAHLIMEAAIKRFGALITIAAALGNLAAAGFLLWAFQRAFLAPLKENVTQRPIEAVTRTEGLLASVLIIILLGSGFYSEPWLNLIDTSLQGIEAHYQHLPKPGMELLQAH